MAESVVYTIAIPVAPFPAGEDIAMPTDVMKLVESVLAEKTAVANKERNLIENLNRLLPDMGYRVVPIAPGAPSSARTVRRSPRLLACPRCSRTFAQPLHLGRHLSATHGVKRTRKKHA